MGDTYAIAIAAMAERIASLTAERDKLREALREIASYEAEDAQLDINARDMCATAREALASVPQKGGEG